jgi:hypothetical protein
MRNLQLIGLKFGENALADGIYPDLGCSPPGHRGLLPTEIFHPMVSAGWGVNKRTFKTLNTDERR